MSYSNTNVSANRYRPWIAVIASPTLYRMHPSDNVPETGKVLSNISVEFSSKVLYEQKSTWAKNRLNAVKKNAEIDGRPLPIQEVINKSEKLLYALLKKG